MRSVRCFLLCLLATAASMTWAQEARRFIVLRELTIYKSHETRYWFRSNPPEVYLSCHDGRPSIDLRDVRRTDRLYTYTGPEAPRTYFQEDGCVTCRLKESDHIIEDQTFGTWDMCIPDFEATGSTEVLIEGEFLALFDCSACKLPEPEPVLQPVEAEEEEEGYSPTEAMESLPTIELIGDLDEDGEDNPDGVYSLPTVQDVLDESQVLLQSNRDDEEASTNGEDDEEEGSGSSGMNPGAIAAICLTILVVFLVVGLVVLYKYPHAVEKFKNKQRGHMLPKTVAMIGSKMSKK